MAFGWDTIIQTGLGIIDKLIPDPKQKAEMKLKMLELQQQGEFKQLEADLQLAQGQIDTNKIEAASPDNFRAGWRPFIGWVCGSGFAIQFVVGPMGEWLSALLGHPTKFPEMDLSQMLPILFGMLGLGAYRTFEKVKGAT